MALDHLKGFILILVVLWIIWFFTGGASRKNEEPFVNPPSNIQNSK